MRLTQWMPLAAMAVAALLFAGCGSKMHTVKVHSVPSGAKVVLDGKSQSDTPGKITIKKDGKPHYLFIRKEGCEEYSNILENNQYPKELNARLNCPPVPVAVDASGEGKTDGSKLGEDEMGEASGKWSSPRDRFENENVLFSYDSSALSNEAREILNRKAEYLRNNPDTVVIIEGHTDERGTVAYNLALGERRALSAKDFLLTQGIADNRMSTISYGEELPADPAQNETAYSQNRRAHFVIR